MRMAITQTDEPAWLTLVNDRCKHWAAFRTASALAKMAERGYISDQMSEIARTAEIDVANLRSALDQLEDHGFIQKLTGDLARQGLMLKLTMPQENH